MHKQLSSGVKGLIYGLGLHLLPYRVYASSKGSRKTLHLCRLIGAITAGQRDKYVNLMSEQGQIMTISDNF